MRIRRRGFTLIELLVVVAIIALLVSILLPSLRSAREHAKEVVCGSTMRVFAEGLANYTFMHKEWIPGVNTTGVAVEALKGSPKDQLNESTLPVQTFDWMTPTVIAGGRGELPSNRLQRFAFLLDKYKCPSVLDTTSAALTFSSGPETQAEIAAAVPRWSTVSYLMPVYFQYWGDDRAGQVLSPLKSLATLKVRSKSAPANYTEARVNGYESRIDRIGAPASKIFVADGTRYLENENGSTYLDHDVATWPTHFGAFTDSGAWWRGSTAYGVKQNTSNWANTAGDRESPSKGENLPLTYRHSNFVRSFGEAKKNKGFMNALYFDGHVELLNDQSSRKPSQWYPKGTQIKGIEEGMTAVESGFVVP